MLPIRSEVSISSMFQSVVGSPPMIAIAAILISGCAEQAPYIPTSRKIYEDMLETWHGKDINDLIVAWGPPSSSFTMPNANKTCTWDRVKSATVTSGGGSSVYLGAGVTAGGGQSVSVAQNQECHTTAITGPSGTIDSWTVKGNDCVRQLDQKEYSSVQDSNWRTAQALQESTSVLLRMYPDAKDLF